LGATNDLKERDHGFVLQPVIMVVAMSATSLRRRCVDDRVKPGHDGKRFGVGGARLGRVP